MLTMYPAVFIPESDGRYSVLFPDFDCATCGDDLNNAVEMAVYCMAGEVYTMQKEHQTLPDPCGDIKYGRLHVVMQSPILYAFFVSLSISLNPISVRKIFSRPH